VFSLLSWLWNRAGRVYDLLGTLYVKVRNAAQHALRWAIDKAYLALQAARAYALTLVTTAKVVLRLAIDAVVTWINARLNDLVLWMLDQSKKLEIFLGGLFDAAVAWLNARISDISAAVVRLKDKIEIWVRDKINALTNTIIEMILPLIMTQDDIDDLLVIFDNGLLSALLDFYERLYNFLSNLKERPLAFILGMLQGVVLTFLSWVTAYALGTTKYRLPPWPSWDEMEIPGPIGPTPGAPSGAGGLARPLSSLYISGHRFREGHRGTDFGLVNGQAVFAAHDARVEAIGSGSTGYGNWLTLRSDTWWTRYAHLEQVTVSRGQRVDSGQQIGRGNSSGNSSGPHLHFEVKHRGSFVDPEKVLNL